MESRQEILSSPCRRPQCLSDFAAQRLMKHVITCGLPLIEEYFKRRASEERVEEERLRIADLIKELHTLKNWYKTECIELGSVFTSVLARALSKVFMHSDIKPLSGLILQVLFTDEAGHHSWNDKMQEVNGSETRTVEEFLQMMAPFELHALSTSYCKFSNPKPIIAILQNAPHLRDICLTYNLSDYLLLKIKEHCKGLECLEIITTNPATPSITDKLLYKVFFGVLNKNELVKCINEKECVNLSFRRLKKLKICESTWTRILDKNIWIFLNYFYPNIETNALRAVHRLQAFSFADILKTMKPLPCFQDKIKFQYDTLYMYISHHAKMASNTYEKNEITNLDCFSIPSLKCIHIDIYYQHVEREFDEDFLGKRLRTIMTATGCKSLSVTPRFLSYSDLRSFPSFFRNIGNTLSSLHLIDSCNLLNQSDSDCYAEVLKFCPNLKNFTLDIMENGFAFGISERRELNPLPNLESLVINSHYRNDDAKVFLPFIKRIIFVAPNLKEFVLDSPLSDKHLHDLIQCLSLSSCKLTKLVISLFCENRCSTDNDSVLYAAEFIPSLTHMIVSNVTCPWREEFLKSFFRWCEINFVCKRFLNSEKHKFVIAF